MEECIYCGGITDGFDSYLGTLCEECHNTQVELDTEGGELKWLEKLLK